MLKACESPKYELLTELFNESFYIGESNIHYFPSIQAFKNDKLKLEEVKYSKLVKALNINFEQSFLLKACISVKAIFITIFWLKLRKNVKLKLE